MKRWLVVLPTALITAFAARAGAPRLSDARYADKVAGCWTGKCIGGALGMPIESWRHADIEKRYPAITGYLGYFDSAVQGWSDFVTETRIPQDGSWRTLSVRFTVPEFDNRKLMAAPIIGLSLERHTAAQEYELRNVRVLRPENAIPYQPTDWQATNGCSWTQDGTIRANYTGERAWFKMTAGNARQLDLKPGDQVVISLEAKWISGDNHLGFALDYLNRDPIKGFGPDDDTSYQIVGLAALEKYGPDLSCTQIGEEWTSLLPVIHPSLAEGAALKLMREGTKPPLSGENPAGEAIGGQMKGEIWGLICPGRPDLAAEYARRDGVVAHKKNGVYGEQFVAAMTAQAFTESDVPGLIAEGLKHVPADSEYAMVVRSVIAAHDAGRPWQDVLSALTTKYPAICDPVFPEAGIVTLALLYGNGDFEKTILIAARCGNDTDCNTATVGALLGCVNGYRALPRKWKDPIGDDFRCFVKGFENWKVPVLTQRIVAAGRKAQAWHGDGIKFSTDL